MFIKALISDQTEFCMFTLCLLKFYVVSVNAKRTSLIPGSAKRESGRREHLCCTNLQTEIVASAAKIKIKQMNQSDSQNRRCMTSESYKNLKFLSLGWHRLTELKCYLEINEDTRGHGSACSAVCRFLIQGESCNKFEAIANFLVGEGSH